MALSIEGLFKKSSEKSTLPSWEGLWEESIDVIKTFGGLNKTPLQRTFRSPLPLRAIAVSGGSGEVLEVRLEKLDFNTKKPEGTYLVLTKKTDGSIGARVETKQNGQLLVEELDKYDLRRAEWRRSLRITVGLLR